MGTTTHPQVPETHPIRHALDEALTEVQGSSTTDPSTLIAQWLLTLRLAMPIPALWEQTRILLNAVLEQLIATGRVSDFVEWLEKGVAQSEAYEDMESAAKLKIKLGRERIHQAQVEDAKRLLREGAAYFEGVNHFYPSVLNALAYLAQSVPNWEESETLAHQALALLSADEWEERAISYRNLGITAHGQRKYESALERFQEALRLWQQGGNRRYIAFGLVNVGAALRPLKRYEEAEMYYLQAMTIFEEVGDPLNRAFAQLNVGNVYLKRAQYELAIENYYAAEQVLTNSDYLTVLANLYNSWGMALAGIGEWQNAVETYRSSIELWSRLDHRQFRANARDNLGLALIEIAEYAEAIATFRAALEDLGDNTLPTLISLHNDIVAHLAQAEQYLPELA